MIALWMAYVVVTSALIAAAARAAEAALRAAGLATRWVWLLALVLSIGLPAATLLTGGRLAGGFFSVDSVEVVAGPGLIPDAIASMSAFARTSGASWRGLVAAADPWLTLGWLIVSAVAALLYIRTWRQLRAARLECLSGEVDGERVLLSREWGPAAIGVRRPEVVIPQWLLRESEEVRRLILLHEREHVRAGDHALLALAPLVAVAIPWNGVLWWQLRRLRLAVEVDCDHRVLARGVETSRYGSLLIEIAGRVRKGVLAPAMAASRSTLEHRIVAMTDAAPRHRFLRSALSAVAVVCCLALACDAPSPAELIEPVGERAAWPELRPVLDQAGGARIELDGRPASIEQIRDLAPDAIRSVEVMKQGEEGTGAIERSLIRVTTRAWAVANGLPDRAPTDIRHAGPAHLELPAGAIYEVNGKRIERDAALAIEPSSIERVEVVKRRSLGSGQDDEMSLVRITLRATAGS